MKMSFKIILSALMMISVTLSSAMTFAGKVTSGKQKKEKTEVSALLGVKPITGTWINLAYKDVRNKYTNPQGFDKTAPDWSWISGIHGGSQ